MLDWLRALSFRHAWVMESMPWYSEMDPEQIEQATRWMEMADQAGPAGMILVTLVILLVFGAIFGTIGGLIGGAVFKIER